MAADIKKNDDFSKGPISKTILRLAVPMVLAQFVNVLYNIVDRMYIGHISDTSVDALTGVGVTFPILLMVTAFANLFGTGGTPLFSMARGAAQQGGVLVGQLLDGKWVLCLPEGAVNGAHCLHCAVQLGLGGAALTFGSGNASEHNPSVTAEYRSARHSPR